MIIKESPCYKCEKRNVTTTYNCHNECEEYMEYRKQLASLGKNEKEDVCAAYIVKSINKRRKAKNEKYRG